MLLWKPTPASDQPVPFGTDPGLLSVNPPGSAAKSRLGAASALTLGRMARTTTGYPVTEQLEKLAQAEVLPNGLNGDGGDIRDEDERCP